MACAVCAGTNKWKYVLTTVLVMNEAGTGVPVAWLLSKYNDAATMRDFLDHLGLSAGHEIVVGEVYMPSHEAIPKGGCLQKAHVNALKRFCPSHVIIDVAAGEIAAIEACMWGVGNGKNPKTGEDLGGVYVNGIGFTPIPQAIIIYCKWHLVVAWGEWMRKHVSDAKAREQIMSNLRALINYEVCVGALSKPQALSKPHCSTRSLAQHLPFAEYHRHSRRAEAVLRHVAPSTARVCGVLREALHSGARAMGACVLPRGPREARVPHPKDDVAQRVIPQLSEEQGLVGQVCVLLGGWVGERLMCVAVACADAHD